MSVERESADLVYGGASASTSLLVESRLRDMVGHTIEILDDSLKLSEFRRRTAPAAVKGIRYTDTERWPGIPPRAVPEVRIDRRKCPAPGSDSL